MERFFTMFIDLIKDILNLLDSISISAFGVNVSLLTVIGSGLVILFVVSIFWRGAKG